jgi:hypothetical protein
MDAEGLEGAYQTILTARAMLDEIGNRVKGIELKGKTREDSSENNAEVAEFLAKSGRDFFKPTQEVAEEIAGIIADRIESELERVPKRGKHKGSALGGTGSRFKAILGSKKVVRRATAAASKAYREGLKHWMQGVLDNIRKQRTFDGSIIQGLSLEYKIWKLDKFGFAEPVGVASGQLKENLDPSKSGNIRLLKG